MNTTNTMNPVIGVFAERDDAERAIRQLRDLGFRDSQIGVTARSQETVAGKETDDDNFAAEGAAAGVAGGAGVGLLWGLGVLSGALPVIGPAIAAGTLAALISSAAAGAAAAGLGGMLIGMGIPRDEATYYESELEQGRYIVTVHGDGRDSTVREVFLANHASDYHNRMEVGRTV